MGRDEADGLHIDVADGRARPADPAAADPVVEREQPRPADPVVAAARRGSREIRR
jgi:hypothetical protein